MSTPSKLTVIVPLFPRQPLLRHAFATLRAQTVRPDLVVLLADAKTKAAERPENEVPGVPVQVIQAETSDLADTINRTVDILEHSKYIAILGAGGAYAPQRLERCLAVMDDPSRVRQLGFIVTGIVPIDGQGVPLGADDKRHAQLARLWAPGREGIGVPEWLGAGDFVLAAANIFARRSYLLANPLAAGVTSFAYNAAIQAAVQGQLEVIDEPLLEFNWSGLDSGRSGPGIAAMLRAQIRMIGSLREKLETSPETRRKFASFHRAAWHNLSGLREDLFAQAALQLASLAAPEDVVKTTDRYSSSSDLLEMPMHLRELREGDAFADRAAYAAALAQARVEMAELKAENERLQRVAEAAQDSGWVRFGAWLGDRSARRIMEVEEGVEVSLQPPNGKVKSGGEQDPGQIGNKQPSGDAADGVKRAAGQHDGNAENDDLDERQPRVTETEKERRP